MGLLEFLESSFLSSLYILDISPLSDLGLVKILSQSVGGIFVLLTVSFTLQKLWPPMEELEKVQESKRVFNPIGGKNNMN